MDRMVGRSHAGSLVLAPHKSMNMPAPTKEVVVRMAAWASEAVSRV